MAWEYICTDPILVIPIDKGYVHTLKVLATAEGGASLTTDEISFTVKCDIVPANYTTVFTMDATQDEWNLYYI